MAAWRKSRLVAILAIVAFLTVQLALPITRLGADETRRFAWQMYSVAQPSPSFKIVTTEGESDVAVDDYVASSRVDVDVIRWLPPHLCTVIPGAIEVTWDRGSLGC